MGTAAIFGKIVLFGIILIALIAALFAALAVYHRYQLKNEAEAYPPMGELVQVNNNNMHVYSEGQGDITLVFMSGHGTSSPVLDFKPLWMSMSDAYRIAVVEKAGYGWSETSSIPRDIDTMLEETRTALSLSGEHGPYVLVPHSLSGLEAIYWAQKYPDEVEAIIGLDPAVPDVYEDFSDLASQKKKLQIMSFLLRAGLSRLIGNTELEKNLPLTSSDKLSEDDKHTMKAMFHKSSITKNMLNEIDYIEDNARKVKDNGIPADTPLHFFISDGSDVIFTDWREHLSRYVSGSNTGSNSGSNNRSNPGQFTYLDCGHYIHHEKSDIIADKAKAFLKETLRF